MVVTRRRPPEVGPIKGGHVQRMGNGAGGMRERRLLEKLSASQTGESRELGGRRFQRMGDRFRQQFGDCSRGPRAVAKNEEWHDVEAGLSGARGFGFDFDPSRCGDLDFFGSRRLARASWTNLAVVRSAPRENKAPSRRLSSKHSALVRQRITGASWCSAGSDQSDHRRALTAQPPRPRLAIVFVGVERAGILV